MQETQEMRVQSLGQEDPLEESMATHSSILACRISWTEDPGRLSPRGHNESDTIEAAEHAGTGARSWAQEGAWREKRQKEDLATGSAGKRSHKG